jgi:hypothetical protein
MNRFADVVLSQTVTANVVTWYDLVVLAVVLCVVIAGFIAFERLRERTAYDS